jgi:FAD synthetase
VRIGDKIIPFQEKAGLQRIKKHKVLVGGCFDVLHYGHLTFLKNAKNKNQILIIALESDDFITKVKKREPIHTQFQRAEILASLTIVDYVVLLPFMKSYDQYSKIVRDIQPQIIAVTKGDSQINNKKKQIESIGGKIKIVTNNIPGFSTSKLIRNCN